MAQNSKGGTVAQILLAARRRVEKDQPLILLDDASTAEDQTVVSEQIRQTKAELRRLWR